MTKNYIIPCSIKPLLLKCANTRTLRKIGFVIIFTLLTGLSSFATEKETRRFSLDSNYRTSSYSNKAIGDFVVEFNQLGSAIAEAIPGKYEGANNVLTRGLFVGVYSSIFYYPLQVAYHEFGHGTRFAAVGRRPSYGVVESFLSSDRYITHKRYTNFFEYYLALFSNPGFDGGDVTTKDIMFTTDKVSPEYDYMISMGGINNDMYLSELIEDEIFYNDKAEIFYLPHYIDGKLSSFLYIHDKLHENGLGDIYEIGVYYNQVKNYGISDDDIKRADLISFFLSGTTYNLIASNINYIFNNGKGTKALSYKKFKLPDVSTYHTLRGISYKVKTGYRFSDDLAFILAVESISKGEDYTEFSLGVNSKIGEVNRIRILSHISDHASFNVSLSHLLKNNYEITLGLDHYNVDTLYGERNITSLKSAKSDTQLSVKLSVVY